MKSKKPRSKTNNTISIRNWITKSEGQKSAIRWIIFAIVGGISISFFGTPERADSQYVFIRLIIPVLIILVYSYTGYKDALRIRDYPTLRKARIGQLADSVYFLGFLWTLWALIDTFVIHELSMAEAVFRAFGYALVTTASGMFLRLAILQFSYSAEDQSSLSERQIEEEVAKFSKEIGNAVKSLNNFQNKLQSSAKTFEAAANNINSKTSTLERALVDNKERVDKLVTDVVDEFADRIKPSLKIVEGNVEKMENAITIGVTKIENKTRQTEMKFSENSTKINERLINSTKAFEEATASFAETLPKQMKKVVSNLQTVSTQIKFIRVPQNLIEETLKQQTLMVNKSLMASTGALQDAIDEITQSVLEATNRIHEARHRRWWRF